MVFGRESAATKGWLKHMFALHLFVSSPGDSQDDPNPALRMSVDAPTLLVIEDSSEQALLFAAAALRARTGLAVHTVVDGLEGITYLAGISPFDDRRTYPVPDLVLLDLVMPEADGLEVLCWLKEQEPSLQVPMIVFMASPSPHDMERARELGAKEVHGKPENVDDLTELVRSVVDRWIPAGRMIGAHIWAMG